MKRNLKPIFLMMALVVGVSFMAFKVDAKDRVEKTALNDYILSKNSGKSNIKAKSAPSQQETTLSEENLSIYALAKTSDLKSKNLASLIKKTDETLWFIMKDGAVDGMVVVNNEIPVKMGGQNRSKELKSIYDKIKAQVNNKQDIKYLEVQGQGVLIIANKDEVYLTKGSRQLLNLEGKEKISGNEFMTALGKLLK